MKLTGIRRIGRYKSPSGGEVNVYRGRRVGRSVDILYYLYRGKRNYISDVEFSEWVQIEC